jgi:hypothetical protein
MKLALAPLCFAFVLHAPAAVAQPSSPPARGEPSAAVKQEASERFNKGVAFSKSGEHRAALLEFKKAYELFPNWLVLYNLGQTSRELKDHASALTWFERYLDEGGARVPSKRRAEVERAVLELRPKVARIRILTSVPGAEITVDDVVVGVAPLAEPVRVNAGRVKLGASLSEHLPVQRLVDVAGAEDREMTLDLVRTTPVVVAPPLPTETTSPVAARPPVAPTPAGSEGLGPWPWILAGTTGALGIGAAVLGVRALGAESDYDDELQGRTSAQELASLRDKAETFALATDVLIGLTAAAGATTIVLFIVDATSTSSSTGDVAGQPLFGPLIGPGYVGLQGAY